MKQRHSWLAGVGIIVAMFTFIACQDDKEEDTLSYPTALVTVKPNLGNTAFTLQLDDSVSLVRVAARRFYTTNTQQNEDFALWV